MTNLIIIIMKYLVPNRWQGIGRAVPRSLGGGGGGSVWRRAMVRENKILILSQTTLATMWFYLVIDSLWLTHR